MKKILLLALAVLLLTGCSLENLNKETTNSLTIFLNDTNNIININTLDY